MRYRRIVIFTVFLVAAIFALTAWLSRQPSGFDLSQYKQKPLVTVRDSGEILHYYVGSRFTLELDRQKFPEDKIHCLPAGVIEKMSEPPAATSSDYAVEFRTLAPGTCKFKNGDFNLTIRIWNAD